MTLRLIVNPSAGGGRAGRALPAVQEELERLGLVHRVELTRDLGHAAELARAACGEGAVAVAFGGDGLVGAVAGALGGTDGVLGVLPGGRGNDFARVLGIPLKPQAACRVLAEGAVRALDLGSAGGRTFIGIASCGFDSDANRIANETRVVRGNLVYAYGALRALVGWRPAGFTISLDDGASFRSTGYTLAAANSGAYGGGMLLAPDASLQDGLLDVVIVEQVGRLRFLRLLPTVFRGTHVRLPNVRVIRARKVSFAANRPFTVFADGDPVGELPITIETLPGAVRTLVPASYGTR
jgi:YegS/Rv2252/BmrU family lipid kinase